MIGGCLIISLILSSTGARIIKRESPSVITSFQDLSSPSSTSYVVRSVKDSSSSFTSQTNDDNNRVIRQSSSYLSPSTNNVFLKSSSSSQPLATTYISSSSQSSGSFSYSSPTSSSNSVSSSPITTTYISSSPVSTPSLTISVPQASSVSSSSSSSSSKGSSDPLAGITALLSPKSSNGGGGGPDILGGIGGAISAASGGVKTALEIQRDVVTPLILGLFDILQNFASSQTLQTIANAKLDAARSALTIGPTIIQTLAELARSAGEVTNSLIKIILCNLICPLQADSAACKVQSSCESGTGVSSTHTLKTT